MRSMQRLAAIVAVLLLGGVVSAQPYNVPDNVLSSHFIRGDSNQDGVLNIADAIATLGFLFPSGTPTILVCQDAADSNNDETLNIADAITTLGFLFSAGAPLAPPFPFVDGDPMPGFAGLSNAPNNLGCKPVMKDSMGNIDPANLVGGVSGILSADATLTNDRTWIIRGLTRVLPGVTLTIQPGTTLIGLNVGGGGGTIASVLFTEAGDIGGGGTPSGRLVANGTETRPIIFTSPNPVGSRARGDWGGLVLLGRGINNIVSGGGTGEIEGLVGEFFGGGPGNNFPDDDSGSLSYVRIEYGGFEIAPDNEINGITFGACGTATQAHHMMVKFNLDDGFEWFGGSMNLRYGFAYGIRDDNFDWANGWNGFGQYWVCEQRPDTGNRGFEVDNHESAFANLPLTNPIVSNVTLLGGALMGERQGMNFRRGTGSRVYNTLVQGWTDCGIDIDNGVTTDNNPVSGTLVVDHSAFALNNETAETGDSGGETEIPGNGFNYTTLEFITTLNPNNAVGLLSSLVNSTTDWVPAIPVPGDYRLDTSVMGLPVPFTALPAWFETPTFLGGVNPATPVDSTWIRRPWVSYMQN